MHWAWAGIRFLFSDILGEFVDRSKCEVGTIHKLTRNNTNSDPRYLGGEVCGVGDGAGLANTIGAAEIIPFPS